MKGISKTGASWPNKDGVKKNRFPVTVPLAGIVLLALLAALTPASAHWISGSGAEDLKSYSGGRTARTADNMTYVSADLPKTLNSSCTGGGAPYPCCTGSGTGDCTPKCHTYHLGMHGNYTADSTIYAYMKWRTVSSTNPVALYADATCVGRDGDENYMSAVGSVAASSTRGAMRSGGTFNPSAGGALTETTFTLLPTGKTCATGGDQGKTCTTSADCASSAACNTDAKGDCDPFDLLVARICRYPDDIADTNNDRVEVIGVEWAVGGQ